ncbi:MAG TPA: oxidoreductase [Gemmatimonadales bacterium]|nr:oxidoreductase [Gemmatimonadales bacterium]
MALIGFGYAGRVFHAPLIAATPGLVLTVLGTRRPAGATGYSGVEAVSDPLTAARHPAADLVVVATPNDSHAPLAEAALRAGKHVVVDKPFTITAADAQRLASLATGLGLVLSVFHNRRWDSDFLGVRRAVAEQLVGEIVELRSEMSRHRPEVKDRWRERPGPGSGLWFDLGPHLIDQALVLFGRPETVSADLRIQRRGGAAVDWFHATLGYGRTRVILTASMLAAEPAPRFLVRGTEGSLTKLGWDPQEARLVAGARPGSPGWGEDPDPMLVFRGGADRPAELRVPPGDYPAYYAGMREALLGRGNPPVTAAEAGAVMAVIEAGERSAAEGRLVVPEF